MRPIASSTLALMISTSPMVAQEGAPLPAVVVAPAEMVALAQTADFPGRMVAIQKVNLVARVSGFLEEINFTEGSIAKAGDTLFVIEDTIYQAQVDQTKAQIQSAQAQEKNAQLDRDRTANLVSRGTVSQADLDEKDATLGDIQGQIAALEAQLQIAQQNLDYTQITAPFEGTLGLANYDIGALLAPESGTLVTLTKLDPIYVEFPVSSALYLDFRRQVDSGAIDGEGMVNLALSNGEVYPEAGTIDFVDAQVNQGTDTVLIRAEFSNPDSILLDGALVEVDLTQSNPEMSLAVPIPAVQQDLAGSFVMVVDSSSTVEQRRVQTGISTRGLIQITDGLQEGENVITQGVNKVRPGAKVDAATEEQAAAEREAAAQVNAPADSTDAGDDTSDAEDN